jgi:hypothetical protein
MHESNFEYFIMLYALHNSMKIKLNFNMHNNLINQVIHFSI